MKSPVKILPNQSKKLAVDLPGLPVVLEANHMTVDCKAVASVVAKHHKTNVLSLVP